MIAYVNKAYPESHKNVSVCVGIEEMWSFYQRQFKIEVGINAQKKPHWESATLKPYEDDY
ncbi:hypothetical protein Holit_03150 [Hollandina sp. SP2]